MSENNTEKTPKTETPVSNDNQQAQGGFKKNNFKMRPKKNNRDRNEVEDSGYDQKIINVRRVSRMQKGGRRMRLSIFVAVGDREGRVGLGIGKGEDVRSAQAKAFNNAKKNMVLIPLKGSTIPHLVSAKFGAAKVLMKPAAPGTGIVAGSSMRIIAEVAGIKDILGKILGTNNKITNAYATMEALNQLKEKTK
jgi:small subunit ribosomal protein S5